MNVDFHSFFWCACEKKNKYDEGKLAWQSVIIKAT